jgi:hypothetical protein
MASCSYTSGKCSPHQPKVKDSSLATTAGTGRIMFFKYWHVVVSCSYTSGKCSPHQPKAKGSSLATTAGTGREL